jgi:hypothetical protein
MLTLNSSNGNATFIYASDPAADGLKTNSYTISNTQMKGIKTRTNVAVNRFVNGYLYAVTDPDPDPITSSGCSGLSTNSILLPHNTPSRTQADLQAIAGVASNIVLFTTLSSTLSSNNNNFIILQIVISCDVKSNNGIVANQRKQYDGMHVLTYKCGCTQMDATNKNIISSSFGSVIISTGIIYLFTVSNNSLARIHFNIYVVD